MDIFNYEKMPSFWSVSIILIFLNMYQFIYVVPQTHTHCTGYYFTLTIIKGMYFKLYSRNIGDNLKYLVGIGII
jgi:hypothetical protein